MIRTLRGLFFLLLAASIVSSCTRKGGESKTGERVVNLAIWSNYISPDKIEEFRTRTGIRLEISNYSSNEELLAKLQAGASGYDVAVPSDYMVFAMSKLKLLHELDYSQLANAKSLDRRYLKKSYDPENKYSVPYNWGTTGIAINRALYPGKLNGWKDLFSTQNPQLSGKFSLLDDARETIGAALKALGFSLNSTKPDELKQAKELLLKTRARVKSFTSETKIPLAQGELAVAHSYVSDTLQAKKMSGRPIEYVIPEEGSTLWIDNLVIPNGAVHLKEAHQLIDFLLEPAVAASIVTHLFVSPVNNQVFPLLPKDLQMNSSLFPSEQMLKKCEMMEDLGEGLVQWDRIWTEVKAQSE